jgi:hypothetical protein
MSATTDTGFDFAPAYRADGWGNGIAWRATGYATEWTEETWEYLGDDNDPDAGADDYYARTGFYFPDENPSNYAYGEPEEVEDRTRVVAHMIGDDRDFTFDIDDLTPIPDDAYCACCGQVGCQWG